MSELDAFLEQARQSGRVESTGRFTLDFARASQQLARYQTADRAFFLLKLIQTGVVGGAQLVTLRLSPTEIDVRLFGRDLVELDTREVLEAFTSPSKVLGEESASAFLSQGLNAALSLEPEKVDWSVWNYRLRERLTLTSSGSKLERLSRRPWKRPLPGYRFRLVRKPPPPKGFWERLRERISVSVDEFHGLYHRLGYCPVTVEIDGRVVDPAAAPPERELLAERYLLATGPDRIALPPASSRRKLVDWNGAYDLEGEVLVLHQVLRREHGRWWKVSPPKGRVEALARLVVAADLSAIPLVTLVHHGITLEIREFDAGCLGVEVVSAVDGLSTDLSQQGIVENEAWEDRVKLLRRHVLDTVADLQGLGPKYAALLPDGLPRAQVRQLLDQPQAPPPPALEAWFRGPAERPGVTLSDLGLQASSSPGADGLVAVNYPDGSLMLLGRYRDGQPCGTQLNLTTDPERATVHNLAGWEKFVRGRVEQTFEMGEAVRRASSREEWLKKWLPVVVAGGQSVRCLETHPAWAPITQLPPGQFLPVEHYPDGSLARAAHPSVPECLLELAYRRPAGRFRQGKIQQFDNPVAWQEWVEQSLRRVAREGFEYIDASFVGRADGGVRATYHDDGQLAQCGYYVNDRLQGWSLRLAQSAPEAWVHHADEGLFETYRRGLVITADGLERHQDWVDWVSGWIECIHRDAFA